MAATVDQLLASGLLPGCAVLGGAAARQSTVRGVRVAGPAELGGLPAGTLAVAPGVAAGAPEAETAIRLCRAGRLAGLVLARPDSPLPPTTEALAERFGVPLVLAPAGGLGDLAADLDRHLQAPGLLAARSVAAVLRKLAAPPDGLDGVLAAATAVLGAPVELVDADGRPLSDTSAGGSSPGGTQTGAGRAGPAARRLTVAEPVRLRNSSLRLAVELDPAADLLAEAARQVLAVTALAAANTITLDCLDAERAGRSRAMALTALVDPPEPGAAALRHAAALGWGPAGWHLAVLVRTGGEDEAPAPLVAQLQRAMAGFGGPAEPVERAGGWACWVGAPAASGLPAPEAVRAVLRPALRTVERRYGLALAAGVGRPRQGVAGLARSLTEAGRAAELAAARRRPAVVELAGPADAGRLPESWREDAAMRGMAADIVGPLLAADPSGELLRTLGCYLDNESSPTLTAGRLRVHRNTVLHRLHRIAALIPVDLADPDHRLAARLAVRLARTERDDPTGTAAGN